ncbi:hypothetical protein SAMN05421797_102261 [Maribacter ulvicola]|uniref:Uncharacterized protein n=1 Tax=Maribacter ulvicola TaxID=228959 RepID=A0A1N6U9Q2_9FLAO|nr:hypothetical protein SAMN05421797_102261 [Maribacter ulvicola]
MPEIVQGSYRIGLAYYNFYDIELREITVVVKHSILHNINYSTKHSI